jgi:G3E family GTPase
MDIILVSGFLGAGKTTLIKGFLASRVEGLGRVALIVNELGEIGIDGTLLSGQNVDMLELTSGCICCTMKAGFVKAVEEIHERMAPDFLIVEATGVAQPADMMETLIDPPLSRFTRLRNLITVINVDMFRAREVLGPFYENQIRCADTLIMNKTDLASPRVRREVEAELQALNPKAPVYATRYCAVDPALLLEEGPRERRASFGAAHGHEDLETAGFQSFSFIDESPLDREKLDGFLKSLPPTLYRLKGWLRFPEGTAHLDYSGGRYRIASVDEPRSTTLMFVGRNCDSEGILRSLRACRVRGMGES